MNKILSIFIGIALLIVTAAVAIHLAVVRPVAVVAEKAVDAPGKIVEQGVRFWQTRD